MIPTFLLIFALLALGTAFVPRTARASIARHAGRVRLALLAFAVALLLPAVALADYANPLRRTYSYVGLDWHSGAITKYVQGPAGKRGEIEEILVVPTTAFVGTSTPANITVGTAGTLNAFATVNMGTAAVPSPVSVPVVFSTYASGLTELGAPPQTYMAKDTPVVMTFNPGTGGGVAGVADVFVTIRWF